MPTNDFKALALDPGAYVATQADYVAAAIIASGFASGKVDGKLFNKALRQPSTIAAAIAEYVKNRLNTDVLDNGDFSALVTQLTNTFSGASVLAAPGYVKIPIVVAGVLRTLIVQWVAPTVAASSTATATYAIPFPNAVFVAIPGSMVVAMTAAYTPGFAASPGLSSVVVQNLYSGSSIQIGVLLIGW